MIIHCLRRGIKIASLVLVIFTLLLPFVDQKEIHAQEETLRQTVARPPENEDENQNEKKKKEAEDENENDRLRAVQRTPGGSRGGECNSLSPQAVTLIVPEEHIGTTVLARPTVIWFNSEHISQPVRLTFYSSGEKPILVKNFDSLPKGFKAFKIPENSPSLEIGKIYKWTVTIVCNEKRPSKNLYAQAWIERVPESLNQTKGNLNCQIDLARLVWYDALSCSYSSVNGAEFNSLLEQIDLSELQIEFSTLSDRINSITNHR